MPRAGAAAAVERFEQDWLKLADMMLRHPDTHSMNKQKLQDKKN